MRRAAVPAVPAVLAALLCSVAAAPASAHEGDPHFDSVLRGAQPAGLHVEVLNYGDRLALRNATGRVVTVEGYEHEPYARLLPDGTVQVNTRSPATYTNDDPYGNAPVPASADPRRAPVWRTLEGDGRFEFHDHRIHWMTKGVVPAAVKDRDVRTKVFDWTVPVRVGTTATAIRGTLWWRGSSGGMPVGALLGFAAFLGACIVLVVVVRRRRGTAPADGDGGDGDGEPAPRGEAAEAW